MNYKIVFLVYTDNLLEYILLLIIDLIILYSIILKVLKCGKLYKKAIYLETISSAVPLLIVNIRPIK